MSKHNDQPTNQQPTATEELMRNETQFADLALEQAQSETVKGGAAYIKFDGIDGEVIEKRPVAKLK